MPDCKTCRENRQSVDPVPYIAHESAMARHERTIKRLWIALMVSIVLWAVTVAGIVYYESQFADETVLQEVDTGEGDAYVAGVRDVNYGEGQTESNETNP